MIRHRLLLTVAAVFVTAGFAAACSDDDDGATDTTASTTTEATTSTTEADDEDGTTTTAAGDTGDEGDSDSVATPELITFSDGVLSDGRWAVGDAGEVEFTVTDAGLELVDARPNEGWTMEIDESDRDEIEVDFERGNEEVEIEIEYENGILEIEIDRDIEPAEPGRFEVGPAAVAEVAVDGGAVRLVGLDVNDGWDVVERDEDDGEVELEFRQGDVRWDFDAELDDGQLEVEIDFEIEGAFP